MSVSTSKSSITKRFSELLNCLTQRETPLAIRFLQARQEIDLDPVIQDVTLDLEEVTTGTLFIARTLWYVDTHSQIQQALDRGASAILVSHDDLNPQLLAQSLVPIVWIEKEDPSLGLICSYFYDYPCRSLKVYGITGTNGKTSAVTYLSEILSSVGERVAVMGTVEYRFESRRVAAPNTTPDALVIQRFARQVLDLGASALALEVSSHALSLDRVAGIDFDAVGFTSFSRDHLDFHGSIEAYREAKGRLFKDYLESSLANGKSPVAVAHDDVEGRAMLQHAPQIVQKVYCSVGQKQRDQVRSLELIHGQQSTHLALSIEGAPCLDGIQLSAFLANQDHSISLPSIEVPLIGDYHPSNVAIALGMISVTHSQLLAQAWQSLHASQGVPGRMERVKLAYQQQNDARVALIDYAHTPDAISRAIEAIRAVHSGHLTVIIGCGGNRDRGKRPQMLKAALAKADRVCVTSDNPRNEEAQDIIDDICSQTLQAQEQSKVIDPILDRRKCIAYAWHTLPTNGALLITGKGHEAYQEIKERRYRLQDHEALRAAAWAEYKQCDLKHVPYALSLALAESHLEQAQFDEVRTLDESIQLTKVIYLLREACLREQGLAICLTSKNRSQAEYLSVHLPMTLKPETAQSLIINQLAKTLQNLSPIHTRIMVESPALNQELILPVLKMIQTYTIEFAYPRPHLQVLNVDQESLETYNIQGGWSTQDMGPKIPSLS